MQGKGQTEENERTAIHRNRENIEAVLRCTADELTVGRKVTRKNSEKVER